MFLFFFLLGYGYGIVCKTCKKWFTTHQTLLKHRLWHHKHEFPIFKFNCDKCPYSTNVIGSFKRHTAVHDINRPFTCSTCGNRFNAMNHLSTHILIHTGERNYVKVT